MYATFVLVIVIVIVIVILLFAIDVKILLTFWINLQDNSHPSTF